MLIVYCEGCGIRVTDKEVQSGDALQTEDKKTYCAKCAPAHFVKESGGGKRSSKLVKPLQKGSERSISVGAPAAPVSPPPPLAPARTFTPAAPAPKSNVALVSGIVGGVIVLALLIILGGSKHSESHVRNPVATVVPTPVSTAEPLPPQALKTTPPAPATTPTPPEPKPETRPVANPAPDPALAINQKAVDEEMAALRNEMAARKLADVKALMAAESRDLYAIKNLLDELVNSYRSTPSGEEAAKLRAEIKLPETRAVFVKKDITTKGNWKGVYGSGGYTICPGDTKLPPGLTVTPENCIQTTWAAATDDVRGLLKPSGPGRTSYCWNAVGMTVNIAVSDDKTRRMAVYFVNWNNYAREQAVELVDPGGRVLDRHELREFKNGWYLVWDVTGPMRMRFKVLSGGQPVVTAFFFSDPNEVAGADPPDNPPPAAVNAEPKPAAKPEAAAFQAAQDEAASEFETIVADAYALLYSGDAQQAGTKLQKAAADPRFAAYAAKLKTDQVLLSLLDEFHAAALKGAALLVDKRPFTFVMADGEQVATGQSAKNTVSGVKERSIQIDKSLGGGTMTVGVELEKLSPQTRLALSAIGTPAGPDRELKIALAGVLALYSGAADTSVKAARQRVEAAQKAGAAADLIEHLLRRVDALDKDQRAEAAFRKVDALTKDKKLEDAQQALEALRKEFAGTRALLRLKPQFEQKAAEIDTLLHPLKPGLWGSYWSGDATSRFKTMHFARADTKLNHNFGEGSPDPKIPNDQFGIKWGGVLRIDQAGTYWMTLSGDDALEVTVDGKLMRKEKEKDSTRDKRHEMSLTKGDHEIKIKYGEYTGVASITIMLQYENGKAAPIPASALWHDSRQIERYQNEK